MGTDMIRIWAAALALLAVVAPTGEAAARDRKAKVEAAPAPPPTPAAPVGPKKRVAVAKFDANGAFTAAYGGWDIGGGLAAQLTTALVDSGRFVVVERPDLGVVLKEQELSQTKITSAGSGPQAGQLLGAQLIVRGSVTEFDQAAKGRGMNIGLSGGGGLGDLVGGGLASKSTQGVVGIDVRVIDASTGQVVQSRRIEKRLVSRDTSLQLTAKKIAFGSDQFNSTVLGQATREAIVDAVAFIEAAQNGVAWTGAVIDVSDNQVFLNTGGEGGVQAGDRFAVMVVQKELTDPTTGQSLGRIEANAGEIRVTDVRPTYSIATMDQPFVVRRGDLIRFIGR